MPVLLLATFFLNSCKYQTDRKVYVTKEKSECERNANGTRKRGLTLLREELDLYFMLKHINMLPLFLQILIFYKQNFLYQNPLAMMHDKNNNNNNNHHHHHNYQREKKKAVCERCKTSQWFDLDEGSFYKHLTNIVKGADKTTKIKCLDKKIQQQQQRMSLKNFGGQYGRTRATKLTRRTGYEALRQIWSNIHV